jgi:hypothetical protein
MPTSGFEKHVTRSRDSVVGIATGYRLDDRGVGIRVPVGSRILSSPRPDKLWGPPSLLPNGYWGALSAAVKRQSEVDHSPPTSVNESLHPFTLHDVVLN